MKRLSKLGKMLNGSEQKEVYGGRLINIADRVCKDKCTTDADCNPGEVGGYSCMSVLCIDELDNSSTQKKCGCAD